MAKVNAIEAAIAQDKKVFGLKEAAAKVGFKEYPIADIKVVYNPRKKFDAKELQSLADSIRENGLLQPIVIDDDLNLVAGERRLRACKLIGLKEIPAVKFKGDPAKRKAMGILENLQREDISFGEFAKGVSELYTDGLSQRDVAKMLGKSPSYISEAISGYEKLKELGREGEHFSFHALRALVKGDTGKKTKAAKKFGTPNFSGGFNPKAFARFILKGELDYKIRGNTVTVTIEDKAELEKLKGILEQAHV